MWVRRLREMRPATAELLVSTWEAADDAASVDGGTAQGAFYARVFAPFEAVAPSDDAAAAARGGTALDEITRAILDKRDAFAEASFRDALGDLTGS